MKSIRDAALYYTGNDAECRQTDVDHWPGAAKDLAQKLLEEVEELKSLLSKSRSNSKDISTELLGFKSQLKESNEALALLQDFQKLEYEVSAKERSFCPACAEGMRTLRPIAGRASDPCFFLCGCGYVGQSVAKRLA
jgi:hypothetical protein